MYLQHMHTVLLDHALIVIRKIERVDHSDVRKQAVNS
jgi:hypothetical protein